MANRFSEITKRIQKKLPYWMKKMRNDEHSIGAQFLNVFGLQLEDVEYVLNYAYQQTNLLTADTNQISMVYKASIPTVLDLTNDIQIIAGGYVLTRCNSLEEFFMATEEDPIHGEIRFNNPYLLDAEKFIIYVRKPYDADIQYKYGRIRVIVSNNETTIFDNTLPLSLHPVWNFFDEFGLFLATPRIEGESNAHYKERLLDVFKHPGGAAPKNLLYGIARELGLRVNLQWTDGGKDYILPDDMITANAIEIDGQEVPLTEIYQNKDGKLVLRGNPDYSGVTRTVSYVHGIEMHALHNKEDKVLQSQVNMPGKPLLNYIREIVSTKAPILWGECIWDEFIWDMLDENTGSTGSILDALLIGGEQ